LKLTSYRERKAAQIENDQLRVTVLVEGGHVAEIFHKAAAVNPLWTPPWRSIEPSAFRPENRDYGTDSESKLLAGIMGHNVCIDLFGGPSPEEAAAGMTVHGEASVVPYQIIEIPSGLQQTCQMPLAGLEFSRQLKLSGTTLEFTETVRNTQASDRPIAWTQHVTLGPPFLERGKTRFDLPGTKCRTFEEDFTDGKGAMKIAADFDWPLMPAKDGSRVDLRTYWHGPVAGGFVTVLMDPHRETVGFSAVNRGVELQYNWRRTDFPWLGIWDECNLRAQAPWNSRTITRGMEFGASPFPESRKAMIERGRLFGVPGYRWIPARGSVTVEYRASLTASRG